jgi:hypothetical protein
MAEVQIRLAGLWIVVMLIYLLGDVLRIFAGDFKAGELSGVKATQSMWLAAAVIMLIPILMIFLALNLDYALNRWANIITAAAFLVFNLIGLRGYPGLYDRFLLAVSLIFNALTIWYAWHWTV